MQTSIQISQEEYRSRADRLLEEVGRRALSGVVLFDRDYILYYTGFAFIPTERPIAFVMKAFSMGNSVGVSSVDCSSRVWKRNTPKQTR